MRRAPAKEASCAQPRSSVRALVSRRAASGGTEVKRRRHVWVSAQQRRDMRNRAERVVSRMDKQLAITLRKRDARGE